MMGMDPAIMGMLVSTSIFGVVILFVGIRLKRRDERAGR